MDIKPSLRIRPLYRMISKDKVIQAIRLIKDDIAQLEKQVNGNYPSIVKDAIEDTLNRYKYDLGYLERRLTRLQKNEKIMDYLYKVRSQKTSCCFSCFANVTV